MPRLRVSTCTRGRPVCVPRPQAQQHCLFSGRHTFLRKLRVTPCSRLQRERCEFTGLLSHVLARTGTYRSAWQHRCRRPQLPLNSRCDQRAAVDLFCVCYSGARRRLPRQRELMPVHMWQPLNCLRSGYYLNYLPSAQDPAHPGGSYRCLLQRKPALCRLGHTTV